MKHILGYAFILLSFASYGVENAVNRHGEIQQTAGIKVWDATVKQWITPLHFWYNYAKSQGGLTWGDRTSYPPYDEVREFDTVLIQLKSGHCLMEFFHARWRRANDVRRWDPAFNAYSGCPDVFK